MKIICDFDGTTAQNDVGNVLFTTFADERCYDIVRDWKSGRIDAKECLVRECSIARATRAQLEAFADSQKLDTHFPDFVRFCREQEIEVEIASDGLDFYIERILRNNDLDSLIRVHANRLVFGEGNRFGVEFPYFAQGCGECGNCKGYHVRAARKNGGQVIYVGDGWSDRCGAREADIVFAKRGRDLIRFCVDNEIAHHEYDDFADVLIRLKSLLIPKWGNRTA